MPTFIDCMLLKNITCVTACVFKLLRTLLFADKALCLSAAQKRDYRAFTPNRQHLFFNDLLIYFTLLPSSRLTSGPAGRPVFPRRFSGRRTIANLIPFPQPLLETIFSKQPNHPMICHYGTVLSICSASL